jgi:4-hydroxybenzoate polyprenyltransferase
VSTLVRPSPAALRLVRAIRVRDWWHFLLLPLASADGAPALLRGMAIAFAILAFGYLSNGLSDRAVDSDLGKRSLDDDRPALLVVGICLMLLALGLSLSGPPPVTWATLVSLLAGTVYSIGPRLKRYPVVGTLANAGCFAPLLWLGSGAAPGRTELKTLAALFVLLLLQNQLLHEAADRLDDAHGQVLTTFRIVGRRGTAVLVAALGLSIAALAPYPALATGFLAAFGLLFPAALFVRGDDVGSMRALRLVHRAVCIVAGGAAFAALH